MLFTANWVTLTFPIFSVIDLLSTESGRATVTVNVFGLRAKRL